LIVKDRNQHSIHIQGSGSRMRIGNKSAHAAVAVAHPGFGHLWQQAEMSDVEIVLSVVNKANLAGDEAAEAQMTQSWGSATVLQQFPGHSPILSLSPYFVAQASAHLVQSILYCVGSGSCWGTACTARPWPAQTFGNYLPPPAQVLRWSAQSQLCTSSQPDSASKTAGSSKRQAKQQVTIALPNASYKPAAMAVLAGLYQVDPWSKLLDDLTPQQQVQAAVLADMWQLPAAINSAVGVLQVAVAGSAGSRVSAVLDELLSLAAVPDCLLPVFEVTLLSKYGNLEAVWGPAGASLQEPLLALPLHAMELLLASDKLKVVFAGVNP
jgi:hypothetical protein